MAAATASAPVSHTEPIKNVQQNSEALQKILSVPLVADSLKYASSTISAYPLIASLSTTGENLINSSLKAAEPLTSRLHPQFTYVDHLAAQTFDFAESKWAYPFHATPAQLYDQAKAPAEQARAVIKPYADAIEKVYGEHVRTPAKNLYDARVAPAVDSASKQFQEIKSQNAYVQRAVDSVQSLQGSLQKTLNDLSSRAGKLDGESAKKEAQGLSNAIFGELERVRSFALTLPTESRKRFGPVLETFTEAYEALNKEARNSTVPASTRFQNVIKYVREQSLPALQKAIVDPEQKSAAVPKVNGSK